MFLKELNYRIQLSHPKVYHVRKLCQSSQPKVYHIRKLCQSGKLTQFYNAFLSYGKRLPCY